MINKKNKKTKKKKHQEDPPSILSDNGLNFKNYTRNHENFYQIWG